MKKIVSVEVIEGDIAISPERKNREYKKVLEKQGAIHCGRCPFHAGENAKKQARQHKSIERKSLKDFHEAMIEEMIEEAI